MICFGHSIPFTDRDVLDTVTISAAKGATITMEGSINFSQTTADGPLITIDTDVDELFSVLIMFH